MKYFVHAELGPLKELFRYTSNDGKLLILTKYFKRLGYDNKTHPNINTTKKSPYIVLYGNDNEESDLLGYTALKKYTVNKNGNAGLKHVIKSDRAAVELFLKHFVNQLDKVNFV